MRVNAKEVKQMERLYKTWHQKEPNDLLNRAAQLPERMGKLGRALDIVYASDKWEEDGDYYDYIHRFEDPIVYVRDAEGEKATSKLLGLKSIDGDIPCVQLAYVKAIVYIDPDGEEDEIRLPDKTILCSTLDKKAVFTIHRTSPIIIRGGKMRVTARGIVK